MQERIMNRSESFKPLASLRGTFGTCAPSIKQHRYLRASTVASINTWLVPLISKRNRQNVNDKKITSPISVWKLWGAIGTSSDWLYTTSYIKGVKPGATGAAPGGHDRPGRSQIVKQIKRNWSDRPIRRTAGLLQILRTSVFYVA